MARRTLPPVPAAPPRVRECHDVESDWAGVRDAHLMDPTPVDDLEAWHAGYDPQRAGEFDRKLDRLFGGAA